MTISAGIFVGIDVAKEKLDIAVLGETQASQAGNDKKGIARLVKKMKKLCPELIVVEAQVDIREQWSWSCMKRDCR